MIPVEDIGLSEEMISNVRASHKWETFDLSRTERELSRLYALRNFAAVYSADIPKSWVKFLADEIARGERRQGILVFEPGQNPQSHAAALTAAESIGPCTVAKPTVFGHQGKNSAISRF